MNTANEAIEQKALITAIYNLAEQFKKTQLSVEDTLWGNVEIADYLKLATEVVSRHVVTRPDFPESLQPCPTGKRAAKRWFAGEVIRWAKQNKGNLPKPRIKNNQSKRAATSEAVAL